MSILNSFVPSIAERRDYEIIREIAASVEGKPFSDWPDFDITWDHSIENLHLFADGYSLNKLQSDYPSGLMSAKVKLVELDSKLFRSSFQNVNEFWDIGIKSKKSEAIAHWVLERKMTPCKVTPHEAREIIIAGGNHRLAVCRAKSIEYIPVLFDPKHKQEISKIISLENIQQIQLRT